ncbi:GDNF family receptor alpha-2-like [Sinocyclocheilus grahami]|uniref:GDNF family receptor alpha-2-like n=1 Tax=Sinocyclocheilus grahami TaxID=75366 RepID=UPI0007AD10B9|nr:PREDICTED: GDNF family receptor alpha-2-like [Sinocyclocheilus grahami]
MTFSARAHESDANTILCSGRSRLADFHMNCQTTPHSITSCPNDNYHGCLVSYVGLIGSDVTPNYVDASHTNITISPWCGCRGSGNHEAECEAFLRDFRENTCLRNAIQAFGYGTDAGLVPITESQSAVPSVQTNLQPAIITKHVINSNDVKQIDSACVFSTCANLQDSEQKCSNGFECADENVLNPMEGSIDSVGSHQTDNNKARHSSVTSISVAAATLTLAFAQEKQQQKHENVLNPMEGSIDSVGSHQTDNNKARHSSVTSISVAAATLTLAFALVNQNVLNPMEGSIDSVGSHQTDNNKARHSSVTSISVAAATLTLAFALVNQVL